MKQTDGDLISRDYVLMKFKEICDRCGKYKENNGAMCRCCALDDAIDYVEDAPSAKKGDRTLKTELNDKEICFLLEFAKEYPETYNKVSMIIWKKFGIANATLDLLCTYVVLHMEEQNNGT